MLTVKRKINNETEKYGGFSEIEVKTPSEQSYQGQSFKDAQYTSAEAGFNYSNAVYTNSPSTVTPKREEQTPKTPTEANYYTADESGMYQAASPNEFMMKIKSQSDEKPTYSTKQKLDHRTKVVLGVYVSIIVLLSALVLTTGILLSSAGTRVDALESELAVKTAMFNDQLDQIEMLSNEDNITGRAFNSGMDKVESAEEIEMLPMGDAQTYEGTTNWFDSFCDWLSGVFGG